MQLHVNELLNAAKVLEDKAKVLREAAEIEKLAEQVMNLESANGNGVEYHGTRVEQLREFLDKKGGAATRQEILREAHIPAGTVSSLLGHRKQFDQDKKTGKWHVKELAQKAS